MARCLVCCVTSAHSPRPRTLGRASANNAAMPATCGVAMLVPLMVLYNVGRGQLERTATPGAAISTCPPLGFRPALEKNATWMRWSRAAIAMMDGQLAAWLTG